MHCPLTSPGVNCEKFHLVLAAASMRLPAALSEADAQLGLANRLALPFARRVFLAYPLPGRSGSRYRVVGRPIRRYGPQRDAGQFAHDLCEFGDTRLDRVPKIDHHPGAGR